jgi:hypothetical protein
VIESAQEVPVLLLAVNFPFGGGIVELELLHGVGNGFDLLLEQVLEVIALVTFVLAFSDTLADTSCLW